MFVLFMYKGEWRRGQFSKPETQELRWGRRIPGGLSYTDSGEATLSLIVNNVHYDTRTIKDLLITENNHATFKVGNVQIVGWLQEGNFQSLIYYEKKLFMEVVRLVPKTYELGKVSELQVSEIDLESRFRSLQPEVDSE